METDLQRIYDPSNWYWCLPIILILQIIGLGKFKEFTIRAKYGNLGFFCIRKKTMVWFGCFFIWMSLTNAKAIDRRYQSGSTPNLVVALL